MEELSLRVYILIVFEEVKKGFVLRKKKEGKRRFPRGMTNKKENATAGANTNGASGVVGAPFVFLRMVLV